MSSFADFTNEYLKKKKKDEEEAAKTASQKQTQSFADFTSERLGKNKQTADIAPVKEDTSGWFKAGAYEDGYQKGDFLKTAGSSLVDASLGVVKGFGNMFEGITDAILYGTSAVSDLVGADEFADDVKNLAKKKSVNNLIDPAQEFYDKNSVFADTMDAVNEGLGYVGGIILTGTLGGTAGLTAKGVSALTTGTTFASAMGGGMSEAYENNASDADAWKYGLLKGTVEAGSELIFGGMGKGFKALGFSHGLSSFDDVVAKKLSSKMSNMFFKNLTELGVKATAEGLEEVLAGLGTAAAKNLTYMSDAEISDLIKDENLLEQFAVGMVTSGITQIPDFVKATKNKTDFITGNTKSEESVINAEAEKRIAEREKNGETLSKKQKNEIYEQVASDLEKGYISTDTIEEALGGETYKSYKSILEKENALREEYKSIQESKFLSEDQKKVKYDVLTKKMDALNKESNKSEIKAQIDKTISDLINQDTRYNKKGKLVRGSKLAESYAEAQRRGQKYEADIAYYDEAQIDTIQKAIDSGILNNTRRTHEFVDMIAKISADKGVSFDFTNNENLKKSRFAVDGATVNGYYDSKNKTVGLNIDSAKSLEVVTGHEITHVLEGTEFYTKLQEAVFEYAKTKGEYDKRVLDLESFYDPDDVAYELTADLVGEYLFKDEDFVNHLSTADRNVFQKIFDEIKYLCKIATKGSKEARQLEKVKRAFEKAYREGGKSNTETSYDSEVEGTVQHSISVTDQKTIDFLENQEHIVTYKAMQLIDGKLYPPMAAKVKGDDGKYRLNNPSELGKWQQATEDPAHIKKVKNGVGYYTLNKGNGKSIDAAYNPYEHSSNLVLNDQFEEAYNRDNIVTVECVIPVSEMTSGYKAEYAKDATGEMDWKSGVVAGKIKDNKRKVYLSRWLKPVRILSDAETAVKFKGVVGDTSVPFNVVTPGLLTELEKVGVNIDYEGSPMYKSIQKRKAQKEVKYSITKDSEGTKLTKEQSEYFKDSKAVDQSGNLLKVYHTTENDFTIFDKSKKGEATGDSNTYLGFFFSDDAEYMQNFPEFANGKTDAYYLNMKNPIDMTNVSKEAFLDVVEVLGGDVYEAAEIYDAELSAEQDRAKLRGDNNTSLSLIRLLDEMTGDADYRSFIEELKPHYDELMSKGYDGVVNYLDELFGTKEYIVLDSNQAKLTTNKNPTRDPDIRYSLSDPKTDRDYMSAIERGDTETAQRIVADVAIEAMPDSKIKTEDGKLRTVYHGTNTGDFTVFNPDYIGMSSGDDGFFGMGFYFAYSKGEAAYYGARRVIPAYLNLKNPFNFDTELQTYKGKKASGGYAPDAVALMNFADKFPEIAKNVKIGVVEKESDTGKDITLPEFAKAFKEVIDNKKFDYQEITNGFGEKETLVIADPQEIEFESYDGTKHSFTDYGFQKRWYGTPNDLDVAYEYLANAVYSYVDMPRRTRIILDNNSEFTAALKAKGYDGAIQSEYGDEAVAFYPEQIKSAEPVTYDDQGNVISLSERFNADNNDIRYHLSPIGEAPSKYGRFRSEDIRIEKDDIAPNIESIGAINTEKNATLTTENANIAPMEDDTFDNMDDATAERMADAERLRSFMNVDDADAPPEMDAPYYGESENAEPQNPFLDRDVQEVGSPKIKAFMYENPEVKPFFQAEAKSLLRELNDAQPGQRWFDEELGWTGSPRIASEDIAYLLDMGKNGRNKGYTYGEIRKGLEAIIEDNGAENNACAKRIEFVLNDRLFGGYRSLDGFENPPNDDYVRLIEEKQITEYSKENLERLLAAENDIAPYEQPIQKETPTTPTTDGKQTKMFEAIEPGEEAEWENNKMARADKVKEPKVKRADLHQNIIDGIKSKFSERGFDLDKVFKNAKNLATWRTVDNTPQRVMEKALGYEAGQILADETVNKVAQNESDGIKWLNSFTDRKGGLLAQISKQYGIKPGSKESAAAQMFAEGFYVNDKNELVKYGLEELRKDFPDTRARNSIIGLAGDERIRQIYDETLKAINESRKRNAYPEIPRRDNYFLHFRAMEDTFSRLGLPFNPNDIRAKDLPTDLNGVTADLKPGQPYFASAMQRRGNKTTYDLLGGVERYLSSAKNQIYHIDDIQTLRALRNYIADTYGQANGLEGLNTLSEEEQQQRIEQVYSAHLSTFAKFLNEEANVIAGKTALIDRGLEGMIGRRAMTTLDTLNKQVGSNMVGFNVSSSMTNLLAGVQAIAKTDKLSCIKALAQTTSSKVGSIFGRTDSFVENNPTIIRRKGADRFYRTAWQKFSDAGYVLAGAVDNVTTEFIVRAKYNEFINNGMSEQQAITEADKWTSRLMGDRSIGQMPQLYNSKMLGLVTKFQLEVRNQLDSQFYDTYQEAKASNKEIQNGLERNAKTAAKITSTVVQLAVLQHLFGKAFESVAGYNPALDIISVIMTALGFDDEEDSEDTALDNIEQGFFELLEDLPYSSLFMDGGRIPISAALPVKQVISGKDKYGNEKSRWETIKEAAPYYLLPGGYGQYKKTKQGLSMFDDDLPVAGSYTDSGNLRFPVEDTTKNRWQAALFGQYASDNARYYFDNDIAPLKGNQIQEFIDSDLPIRDYWKYRKGLSGLEKLSEKADYINSLDLPIRTKNLLINNIADRKENIDMTDYGKYSSFEEFDFAEKNPEKYNFLKSIGVSYSQYENADDDTKDAYSWAYNNPDKYTMSKAISNDVVVYRKYTKALNDIKADKDSDGKSISGSRKKKVAEYLNSLDAEYGAKIILFKSEYPSDHTYNRDIIEYLDNREDISYEEMVIILQELGFKVDANGNVRW